jgi:hypothetical protein
MRWLICLDKLWLFALTLIQIDDIGFQRGMGMCGGYPPCQFGLDAVEHFTVACTAGK